MSGKNETKFPIKNRINAECAVEGKKIINEKHYRLPYQQHLQISAI